VSVASATCLLGLQRLQPLLAAVALVTLSYQARLVWRRPASLRTTTMLLILWGSIGASALVASAWVGLWLRYR
jgi:hypothetical protein